MKKLVFILAVFQAVLSNAQEVRYRMNMADYMPPYSDKTKTEEIIANSVFNLTSHSEYHSIKPPQGKYKKIAVWPNTLLSYSPYLEPYKSWFQYQSEGGTASSEKKYLYRALLVCDGRGTAPDTAKIVLFFSTVDCGKSKGKLNTVVKDIDSKQILLWEQILLDNPPLTNIYSQSDIQKPVYPSKVYKYTLSSINPKDEVNPEILLILNTFMQKESEISLSFYKESTEVRYEKGKIISTTDVYFNDSGQRHPFSRIIQYDPMTGREKSVVFRIEAFNTGIGVDLATNTLLYEENYSALVLLGEEGKGISLPGSIKKAIPMAQVFDEKKTKDFIVDLKKHNEMIFINPFGLPDNKDKYIYTGAFKNNVPDGWGLMYLQNRYEPAYYFGEFKNGVPDGFGFRYDMAVPKDTLVATAQKIQYNNVAYTDKIIMTAGLHTQHKLLYGLVKSRLINNIGSSIVSYRTSFGDFRPGKLTGEGLDCFIHINSSMNPPYCACYKGTMQEGALNGNGAFLSPDMNKEGVFKDGIMISGTQEINRIHYEVGRVIRIDGKRYVIMSKNTNNNTFLLDNGKTISSKDSRIEFTYQMSLMQAATCLVCNGTGWITESWENTYSGNTTTQKSYHTGPTGYVVWEKTTTTTTAPITVHSSRTKKCACGGGVSYKGPKALSESER